MQYLQTGIGDKVDSLRVRSQACPIYPKQQVCNMSAIFGKKREG